MKVVSTIIKNIPLTCKVIYIVSTVLYIIGIIFSAVPLALANFPEMVWVDKQIYRLFLTFFSKGQSVLSIISIFVDFLWIRFFFTKLEKKYSTVFFTVQIFIQNLILQIIFTLLGGIFVYLNLLTSFLISYGWTPLIVIFMFKMIYKNSDQTFKLFCFNVPKKYIPVAIIVLSLVFAFDQFLCILLAIFLGYLQYGILGRDFIHFPIKFYKGLEGCLPNFIKKRQDFIKFEETQKTIVQQQGQDKISNKQESNNQLEEQKKQQKQKKVKKIRKTGRKKSINSDHSADLKDQIESGKSTKEGQLDNEGQLPQIQTDQNLEKIGDKL